MMVHVADAAKQYNSVIICTVDSGIVVLAVHVFAHLTSSLTALWVAFGTGKSYQLIPVHSICTALGHPKCLALPMFHALMDCDTTTSFSSMGKKSAWKTWDVLPELKDTLNALMGRPEDPE